MPSVCGDCAVLSAAHPRCLGLLVDSVSLDTSMASSFLSPCRDRLDAECGDLGEEAEAAAAEAAEEGEAAAAKPLKSKSSKLSGEGAGAGAAALEEAADEDEEPEPNAAQSASPEEEEGAASNDASHDDDDEDAAAAVGLEGTGAGAKKDVSKRVAVAGGGGEREAAGGRDDAEEAEADWGDFTWLWLDFLARRGAGSSSSLLLSLLALLWPGLAGEAGLRRGAARAEDEADADDGEGEGAGAAAGKLPKSAQSSSAGAAAADEAAAAARALRSLRARLASFAAAAAAAADPVALASAPAEWCRCKRSGSVTACEGCGTLFAPALSCDDTERLLAGLATPPPLSHACHCSHSASVCVMSGRLVGSTVSSRLMSAVRYLLKG